MVKGITIDQDAKSHSVNITIEIAIQYGKNIPKLAEEIQTKVSEAITEMTGMRVASVHVVFRELIQEEKQSETTQRRPVEVEESFSSGIEHEF